MDAHVIRGFPEYTAARITVDERCDDKIDALFEGAQYVRGFECSSKGELHYHILMCGLFGDKIAKRWTRYKSGASKKWSKANHGNNFLKGVSYTIKDKDIKVFGEEMEYWVAHAPVYVKAAYGSAIEVGVKWLTYRNGMKVIKEYRITNDMGEKKFEDILEHMIEIGGWRPDEYLAHRGIPTEWQFEIDQDASTFACGFVKALMARGRDRYRPY